MDSSVMQQDIHFVLRVQARFTKPATRPDGEADPNAQETVACQGIPDNVDPASLSLQLAFTPWAGQEVTAAPAAPVLLGPEPRGAPGSEGEQIIDGNPSEPDAAVQAAEQAVSKTWQWTNEKHFKVTVDEAFVRCMTEAHGELVLPISIAQPPPEPPAKPVKGQPPAPEPVAVGFNALLPLQCAALLTGDTQVVAIWPDKLKPLPKELEGVADQVVISIQTLDMPQPGPEQIAAAAAAQAAAAKGGKGAKPAAGAAKGGKPGKDAAPEPDLADTPGQPCAMLTPGLASRLNPIVICPLRANALPDAPATPSLLDTRCHPVKLCIRWPAGASNVVDRPGRPGPWQQVQPADRGGPGLACRSVGFGQPMVLLAGDMQMDELTRWCRENPLCLEVHDRTVIPEPPEFPIQAKEGDADAPAGMLEEEGYVCGIARIPLLDLARGRTCVKFTAPLAPHTTIRGAASLDWGRRPGNYVSAQAVIKGWVRCAVPLPTMTGTPSSDRIYSRAVFIMDYRDSELFHTLEDTIRQQNAWALGLAAPNPQAADLAAQDATKSSADNSNRNSRSSTPTSHRPSNEADEQAALAHSTHSVVRLSAGQGGAPGVRISSSAGPLTRDGSRGILRASDAANSQGQQTARVGDGWSSGGTQAAGARVVLSGHGARDRKELRFHDFGDGDSENSSDNGSEDKPATAVEAALDAALAELQTIKLDNRLTQALSTIKLSDAQASDAELDLLTGWHLVDGKERMIAVEGRSDGAMKVIQAITAWALETAHPEDNWRKRVVLHNSSLLSPNRLWSQLGVDLHIVKLHMPLTKIIADAASYATGKVRVECIAGLRRLAALRMAGWSRVVSDLCLYPTPHQVHLVDKKFGGELSKADVFGVEVEEFDTDEEDGGGMGLVKDEDVRSSHSSSKRSGRSRKSMKSRKTSKTRRTRSAKYSRKHPALQPLDRHNESYLAMREEARARRMATDWHAHNLTRLATLTSEGATIRESWATWNPQREAAKKLEEAVKQGTISLQDTIAAHASTQREPLPGTLTASQAKARGWAPHTAPFKWPAPKDPKLYAVHPHAPSMFRVEQLAEPWEEEAANPSLASLAAGPPGPVFVTTIKNATGLFGQDPEFWKTVHLSGSGREKEEAELKAAEKAQWQSKLLGAPVMHTTLPIRSKPAQTDRTQHILYGQPQKKGFTLSYVPPCPLSAFSSEPWTGATTQSTRTKDPRLKNTLHNTDFVRHLATEKRAVCKPGHGNLQSWTAAMHDKYYQEN